MSPPTTVVRVDSLGVRYDLRLSRENTVRRRVTRVAEVTREKKAFWALQGVSFRVRTGECLGVIGPNGAGKSTLLQALAGILEPSTGTVQVDGRVSTLLSLGAGFDIELTGRQNVFLAGAFMGIGHREMESRLPSIVDFAGLGEFIDAPIRSYSSGMRARLGFSVASSIDPDVLLLDEVLGTGDQAFRAKSRDRVLALVERAGAVVLVTHDMSWVTEFCSQAILLDKGAVVAAGPPAQVVGVYRDRVAAARSGESARSGTASPPAMTRATPEAWSKARGDRPTVAVGATPGAWPDRR